MNDPTPLPLIRLDAVWKSYGERDARVDALAGVSFSMERGEFVAITGPSGSGKSTAMNIIGCLDTPTAGNYRFLDLDAGRLDRNRRAALRNAHIGFVFQGYNLLPRTTALENVELPLIYRGVPPRERRERSADALQQVGLQGREHHAPMELSGGQQQRVAIARALVSAPTLLVADEPTGNLDTKRSREIMDLLIMLNRERGMSILLVTHEAEIAACAGREIRFHDGRIADDRRQTEAR
ncbi:ABC transporter ATP-binding protein [Nitratireductor sp. ZSWI3]|uniref:ABC transporter ATP-binding protein n=1 Tax=Nitratireductor sp. ZSWI3 TaxID=2966359 RepID=UPI00214F9507|nr:ABC transporter ATP-binding protein [Nitratireductor sp. ZSWI3]MCR4268044.1 ABC transporter ATP-binding protein [Nitratireductor sp. ZSWI3]